MIRACRNRSQRALTACENQSTSQEALPKALVSRQRRIVASSHTMDACCRVLGRQKARLLVPRATMYLAHGRVVQVLPSGTVVKGTTCGFAVSWPFSCFEPLLRRACGAVVLQPLRTQNINADASQLSDHEVGSSPGGNSGLDGRNPACSSLGGHPSGNPDKWVWRTKGHHQDARAARTEPGAVKPRAQLGQTVLVQVDEISLGLDYMEGQETENTCLVFMPHIVFEGATVGDPACGFVTVITALADKSLRTGLVCFRPTSAFAAVGATGPAAVLAGAFATASLCICVAAARPTCPCLGHHGALGSPVRPGWWASEPLRGADWLEAPKPHSGSMLESDSAKEF